MGYISETEKIRPKIEKYLSGIVIDIGCGHDPVTPNAFGIDCRKFDHVKHVTRNLHKISEELSGIAGTVDVVYSSHCLEHFSDDRAALADWIKMAKVGGNIILYLPDDRVYNNDANPEHVQRYVYDNFLKNFITQFPNIQVIESGEDFGDDRYSFFVVMKKMSN